MCLGIRWQITLRNTIPIFKKLTKILLNTKGRISDQSIVNSSFIALHVVFESLPQFTSRTNRMFAFGFVGILSNLVRVETRVAIYKATQCSQIWTEKLFINVVKKCSLMFHFIYYLWTHYKFVANQRTEMGIEKSNWWRNQCTSGLRHFRSFFILSSP